MTTAKVTAAQDLVETEAAMWAAGAAQTEAVPFANGDRGYINDSDKFIGRYVGENPDTGSLVFWQDGHPQSYHKHQVTRGSGDAAQAGGGAVSEADPVNADEDSIAVMKAAQNGALSPAAVESRTTTGWTECVHYLEGGRNVEGYRIAAKHAAAYDAGTMDFETWARAAEKDGRPIVRTHMGTCTYRDADTAIEHFATGVQADSWTATKQHAAETAEPDPWADHRWSVIGGNPVSVFEFRSANSYRHHISYRRRGWCDFSDYKWLGCKGEREITRDEAAEIMASKGRDLDGNALPVESAYSAADNERLDSIASEGIRNPETAPVVVPWTAETFPKDRPVWIRQKHGAVNAPLNCAFRIVTGGLEMLSGTGNVCVFFIRWDKLLAGYIQPNGDPCGEKGAV